MLEVLENLCNGSHRYQAIALGLLAGFSFGLSNFLQKVVVFSEHPTQIAFGYSGLVIVLLIPAFLITRQLPVPAPEERKCVVLACVTQAVNFGFCTASLYFIPVFNATIIADTSVLFSTLLAHFFLNERMGLVDVFLLLFTLIGIVLLAISGFLHRASPSADPYFDIYGTILAMCAAITYGFTVFLFRKIQATSPITIILYVSSVLFLLNFIIGMALQVIHFNASVTKFGFLLAIAVLMVITLFCQIKALRQESCLTANLTFDIDSPTALTLQLIFLKIYLTTYEIIGAVFIVSSIILINFKDHISKGLALLKNRLRFREEKPSPLISDD